MKKYILSLMLLIFIGCGKQDTMLKITFVDDCKNKLLNDKVTVKITKIGLGKMGELVIPVGNENGMTIVLDEGKYNLVCSGVGKGLFTPSSNWRKTITLKKGQRYRQSFTCQETYD